MQRRRRLRPNLPSCVARLIMLEHPWTPMIVPACAILVHVGICAADLCRGGPEASLSSSNADQCAFHRAPRWSILRITCIRTWATR